MLSDTRQWLTVLYSDICLFNFPFLCISCRILRLSVLYLRNHSIQHGFLDSKMYQAVASILAIFVNKWKIFKEQEREREEEEGNLFKFRNKIHGSNLTEDEENKEALSQAFPTFDGDFKDIMAPQDLNENVVVPQGESESSTHASKSDAELFTSNITDFSEIRKLHEETFCRFPSSQDFSLDGTDRCPSESLETLYLETFQWSYQTAAVVNAIIPCKWRLIPGVKYRSVGGLTSKGRLVPTSHQINWKDILFSSFRLIKPNCTSIVSTFVRKSYVCACFVWWSTLLHELLTC